MLIVTNKKRGVKPGETDAEFQAEFLQDDDGKVGDVKGATVLFWAVY